MLRGWIAAGHRRAVALLLAGCSGAGVASGEVPTQGDPASSAVPHGEPAPAATTVAPASCSPVSQPFETAATLIDRLPVSKRSVGRRSIAENVMEVAAIPGRPDTARVVFQGNVHHDISDPATRRRLVRWLEARHARRLDGWNFEPRGTVIVAESSVEAAVIADLVALASGERYDGPVDIVLRHAGTRAMTTIPVVLDEGGLEPVATWGEWAAAIDAAAPTMPVVLSPPDTAAIWAFREDLPHPEIAVRIDVEPRALRSAIVSHRYEIEACYLQGVLFDPELQGAWFASLARDRKGRIASAAVAREGAGPGVDERFTTCLGRVARRWRLPAGKAPVRVDLVATVHH